MQDVLVNSFLSCEKKTEMIRGLFRNLAGFNQIEQLDREIRQGCL